MRLQVTDRGVRSEIVCEEQAIYIGSKESCAVFLPDERIAGEQAVIFVDGEERWYLQPLDLAGEMLLNDSRVAEKTQLKSGDEIRIYDTVIKTLIDDGSAPAARAATPTTSVAQMARFVQAQLPPGAIVKKVDESLTLTPAQLARIARANTALGGCDQVERLMNVAIHALQEIFGAQRVWIGIRRVNYGPMEYVEGRSLAGPAVELPEVGDHVKPRVLDRGQFIVVPIVSVELPFSLMVGPLPGPDGPLGMAYIDSGDAGRRYDHADFDFFIALLNTVGAKLDAIFKAIAKQRGETIQGEITVVHAIQARLTPRKLPQWEELQFGAFREPGRQRTGDVYDIIRMANQHAGIMIANTPTTGPLPGMVMSQAQAAFRSAVMHNDAPHIFQRSLNFLLYDGLGDRTLDCFMALIDPKAGLMRYSLAGRVGAYVIGARGEERKLGGDPSPPLGSQKAHPYALIEEQLESEETLVLFTPGVVTARNSKDEAFGEERFINILCDGFGQLASNMLKEMLSDVQHFTQSGQQPDDITVILAHRV